MPEAKNFFSQKIKNLGGRPGPYGKGIFFAGGEGLRIE